MIGRWPCIVVAMLFCLLAVATSACDKGPTWILWVWEPTDTQGGGVDAPIAAYANQKNCLAALATGRSHRAAFVTSLARCLPDTVDPLGPKGK